MNPIAIIFWALCGLVGYLIGDGHGAVIGPARRGCVLLPRRTNRGSLGIVLLVSFLDEVG
jgi:hypothetical protein